MAESAPTSTEDESSVLWFSNRRCRKSGCSNIFKGVNMHQLHRLFQTAGDREAEHRAKLVWRGMNVDIQQTEEEKEAEDTEDAALAQALVGLRVRARTKAGFRAEGPRDHKWLRASAYLQIQEPLSGYSVMDEEVNVTPGTDKFPLPSEEKIPASQNPFKPSSWSLGVARHESARELEHYLHRILH